MPPRTFIAEQADLTIAKVVRDGMTGISWNRARDLVRSGRVLVNGERVLDPALRLAQGASVEVNAEAPRMRKGMLPREAIVYLDPDVVVVNKPAGIMSVPFEPTDRDTLVDITRAALRQKGPKGYNPELGVVHRIDVDTTGLLVFTRTLSAKRHLTQQFRDHSTHRRYVALVHGELADGKIESVILRDRGDGLRGSYGHFRAPRGEAPEDAQHAVTHVRALEKLRGATLVECRLETGRQHQIRIHLSERGSPLLGEKVYIRDYRGPRIDAPRPMLHAIELGFVHPRTEEDVHFSMDPPVDFVTAHESLRTRPSND